MYLVDMTDWQKIREANPSAAVPVVCDALDNVMTSFPSTMVFVCTRQGQRARHCETGAFHIIPISIGRFWMFFEACPKQHPLASLFPSSCRQMQRHQTSLVQWYILQFPTLVSFLEVLFFQRSFTCFGSAKSASPWCFWCQAIMTWWRQTCEPTLERWWISALPTGVVSEIHGVFWYPTFMVHKMASWHVHEPRNCQDRPLGRNESVFKHKTYWKDLGRQLTWYFSKENFSQTDPCLLQDPGYFQSRTFQRWSVPRWLIFLQDVRAIAEGNKVLKN